MCFEVVNPLSLLARRLARRAYAVPTALAYCTLASCGSTTPLVTPIAGQTFDVISIAGRPLPTTLGIVGRLGTCDAHSVGRVTLAFGKDGSFVETVVHPLGTSFTIATSFSEVRLGTLAVIYDSDTATVTNGLLRVLLRTANCAHEELVARAMQ